MRLLLFPKQVHVYPCLDSSSRWYYVTLVFPHLADFTSCDHRLVSPRLNAASFTPLRRGDTACVCVPHLLYPPSGLLHSGCFCILAVGPSAAMILVVPASFKALVFLGSTLGCGMAASHVRWVLSRLPLQCRELVMDVMNRYIIEPGRR